MAHAETFSSGTMTFLGKATQNLALAAALSVTPSPALTAAHESFAAIAAERATPKAESATERMAATMERLTRSKAASNALGEAAFGGTAHEKSIETLMEKALAIATEKHGAPGNSSSMELKPQFVPAPDKNQKLQIS